MNVKTNLKAFDELKRFISSYETDTIDIVDELPFSQYTTLRTIEFYSNSRYLEGNKDHLKRTKPFYNISKFRVNVAVRATDLDLKDFQLDTDTTDTVMTMLYQKELYKWMKEANLSKTLNDFGHTRAKYGGVILKKSEKNGKLKIDIVDWNKLVTDQINIGEGAIAELHYLSPSELNKKRTVWENIDEAISQAGRQRKAGKSLQSKASTNRVEVWELHGEFPIAYLKNAKGEDCTEEDDYIYSEQVYYFAGPTLLYCDEMPSPYKYIAWEEVPGRSLGWGVVEDGFEAQVWTNDAIINQKNAMDIAGKVVVKHNAMSLGDNFITDIDNGQMIELGAGEDMNLLNLTPASLPIFATLIQQWDTQYERVSSTYDAVTGQTMPSNTPFRSVALQSQEGNSFFLYRMEEAGIFWQEVFNDWVFPHLTRKLTRQHILASDFDPEELRAIDRSFSTFKANQEAIRKIFGGEMVTADEYQEYIQNYETILTSTGEKRFIDIPKGYFKDANTKMTLIITGERKNKVAILESLGNILQIVGQAPQVLTDPSLAKIFSRIIEMSGIGISAASLGLVSRATNMEAKIEEQMQEPQMDASGLLSQLQEQGQRPVEPIAQ